MLGLWSLSTTPMGMRLHVAFAADLDEVLRAPDEPPRSEGGRGLLVGVELRGLARDRALARERLAGLVERGVGRGQDVV